MQNTRGFQAAASVPINSPTQNNNQNVNVIVTDSSLTKDKAFSILNTKDYEYKEIPVKDSLERSIEITPSEEGLNDNLEPPVQTRNIETAKESLEELRSMLKDKDNLIEALSLILDIYENNPFIINKFIVAEENELTRLLFLLTGAEQIELIKRDPETGCTCKVDKVTYISKIMVKKNGNSYNFKYSFPNVVQLLENRHISYKMVI